MTDLDKRIKSLSKWSYDKIKRCYARDTNSGLEIHLYIYGQQVARAVLEEVESKISEIEERDKVVNELLQAYKKRKKIEPKQTEDKEWAKE